MNYNSLEEIESRKAQLKDDIQQKSDQIGNVWRDLTTPQPTNTKGEMVASLVTKSITAIDAFLLMRKLMRNYGFLFGRKKRK
jgi:hypothetical protein